MAVKYFETIWEYNRCLRAFCQFPIISSRWTFKFVLQINERADAGRSWKYQRRYASRVQLILHLVLHGITNCKDPPQIEKISALS